MGCALGGLLLWAWIRWLPSPWLMRSRSLRASVSSHGYISLKTLGASTLEVLAWFRLCPDLRSYLDKGGVTSQLLLPAMLDSSLIEEGCLHESLRKKAQ